MKGCKAFWNKIADLTSKLLWLIKHSMNSKSKILRLKELLCKRVFEKGSISITTDI